MSRRWWKHRYTSPKPAGTSRYQDPRSKLIKPAKPEFSRREFIASVTAAGAAAVYASGSSVRAQTGTQNPVTPRTPDGPLLKAGPIRCGGRGSGPWPLRNQGALWYRVPQPGWSDMEYMMDAAESPLFGFARPAVMKGRSRTGHGMAGRLTRQVL